MHTISTSIHSMLHWGVLHMRSIHNVLRWVVVLLAPIALLTGLRGLRGNREFTGADKRIALFFLIGIDLQLLAGLFAYYLKGYFWVFDGNGHIPIIIREIYPRYWTLIHPFGMLLAIILIHVAYAGTRGARPARAKYRRYFWFTFTGMAMILMLTPWPFRLLGIARPWWPGVGGPFY